MEIIKYPALAAKNTNRLLHGIQVVPWCNHISVAYQIDFIFLQYLEDQ